MDFALSEEQERLRDSARELLARECPSERVRKIMEGASGHDPDLQRVFAEAGWLGCLVPEAHGGAGLALLDAAVLLEELGRALVPGPFLTSSVAAVLALREAGSPAQQRHWLPRLARGDALATLAFAEGPEGRLLYVRNERYWGGSTKLDGIEILFLDEALTMEAYRNDEVDIVWPGEENIPAIEADPDLSRQLVIIPEAGTQYFTFNLHREPFQDPKVRQAFAYAFDRDAYCRQVASSGACRLTMSLIPPGMPGGIETDAYAFDPEKARQAQD